MLQSDFTALQATLAARISLWNYDPIKGGFH